MRRGFTLLHTKIRHHSKPEAIELSRTKDADGQLRYLAQLGNGSFELGFSERLLDLWGWRVDSEELDTIAEKLAKEILNQHPSAANLQQGFWFSEENAFATPTAALERLRLSGIGSFQAT